MALEPFEVHKREPRVVPTTFAADDPCLRELRVAAADGLPTGDIEAAHEELFVPIEPAEAGVREAFRVRPLVVGLVGESKQQRACVALELIALEDRIGDGRWTC